MIKRECNDVVCLAADLDDLDLNDPDQRIEFLDICGQIRDRIFKVQQKIGEVYR